MATRTVPCRVCGKMFVPCNKPSSALGAFNYHSVACSPECGAEYFRRVQAARQKPTDQPVPDATVSTDEPLVGGDDEVRVERSARGKRRNLKFYEEKADTIETE